MPPATSMQDCASSGVKKLEAAGGDSAWREVGVMVEDGSGLMGENASIVEARAIKMARVGVFIFIVQCFVFLLCFVWYDTFPFTVGVRSLRPGALPSVLQRALFSCTNPKSTYGLPLCDDVIDHP